MVQMSTKSILADCYGMSIVGISRRYVADLHFFGLFRLSLFRYRTRHMESRDSDTTMNKKKCSSPRSHIFLFMIHVQSIAKSGGQEV